MPSEQLTTLILDYDQTITLHDTTHLISTTISPIPQWDPFLNAYLADYSSHTPPPNSDLETYLNSFRVTEQRSISCIEDAGILHGTTREILRELGRTIETQPRWDLVAREWLKDDRHSLYISSVNWSRDLIDGTLQNAGINIPSQNIISNDLEFDERDVSTGRILAPYLTGPDKLQGLRDRLGMNKLDGCIYVGDSTSDIPSLLSSTLGILIKPSSSVTSLCKKFDLPLERLSGSVEECKRGVIYVAEEGWVEIYKTLYEDIQGQKIYEK